MATIINEPSHTFNEYLLIIILRMKMGRVVIIIIHGDFNPKKFRYFRHNKSPVPNY